MKIVFFILLVVLAVGVSSCGEPKRSRLILNHLEIINKGEGKIAPCIECKNKIVVFHDFTDVGFIVFSSQFLDWNSFREEFPEVGMICYLSGVDRNKAIRGLNEVNFPYEVYYDSAFSFYKLNPILKEFPFEYKHHQAYFVIDDEIVDYANFGIKDVFYDDLDNYFEF